MTWSSRFHALNTLAAMTAITLIPGIASAQFTLNGSATSLGPNSFRLTNGFGGEAGSVFDNNLVSVNSPFDVVFQVHMFGPESIADGTTFTVQKSPAGVNALGNGGGDLGYAGISNSVAVKFDTFQNSTGFFGPNDPSANSTGLFTNGAEPIGGIDLNPSGVNLHQDVVSAELKYDGSTTLTENLKDLNNGNTFSTSYGINIASTIGSNVAYVGFTGGTGGAASTQDISNVSISPEPPGASALIGGLMGFALMGGLVRRRRAL